MLVSGDLTWSNYFVGPNTIPVNGQSWCSDANAPLLINFLEDCNCVPEPASLALFGIGGVWIAATALRRRNRERTCPATALSN